MELTGVNLGLHLLLEARTAGLAVGMRGPRLAVAPDQAQADLTARLLRHEPEVLAALQRYPSAREDLNLGSGDHDAEYVYEPEHLSSLFGNEAMLRLAAYRRRVLRLPDDAPDPADDGR